MSATQDSLGCWPNEQFSAWPKGHAENLTIQKAHIVGSYDTGKLFMQVTELPAIERQLLVGVLTRLGLEPGTVG